MTQENKADKIRAKVVDIKLLAGHNTNYIYNTEKQIKSFCSFCINYFVFYILCEKIIFFLFGEKFIVMSINIIYFRHLFLFKISFT